MSSNLVSVIVPVFNRSALVGKTLESILRQTYPRVEIVAVDDGSTDDSLEVLRSYERRYPGRIGVVEQQNQGQVVARNTGIERSSGEYVAFLDSDDTWHPEKLEKQLPLMRPGVGLVYSSINEVDESGTVLRVVHAEEEVRGSAAYASLLIRNRMTGGTVVLRRAALDRVGLFDASFQAAENWDLWIRVAKEYAVDFVDEPLLNYLRHVGNMSRDSELMLEATRKILEKHLPQQPVDERLVGVYRQAWGNYHYRRAMDSFGQGRNREARGSFRQMALFVPLDVSARVVLARTYLGHSANRMITTAKKRLLKLLSG